MASTLTTLMQRALYEMDVGLVIPTADISAFAAGTFTAARWAQNTNLAADYFQIRNAGFIRAGAATAADMYRPAGTLVNSTGVVSQVGPSWADTTVGSEDLEAWYYGVRRDQEVLKSLNRVTQFRYTTTMLAVSHLSPADGDMALSTDSLWTDVSTPTTSAKSTVAADTLWGPRSYHLIGDAVNEGTQSSNIFIKQGGSFSAYSMIAAATGTVSFRGRDVTNSADIGTAVTHSEIKPQFMAIRNQVVPATCKSLALRALGTTNPSDFYINQMWLYNLDDPTCPLPSSLTESFQAPRIYQGVPQYQTATDVYDAGSLDFRPLTEGIDYWFVINHNDAQAYKVRFRDTSYFANPLFIEARIPMSSQVTLSAESDSLSGSINEIIPAFKKDLLETVYNTGSRRHPDWTVQHNLATQQLTKATNSRKVESIANPTPYWAPRLSAS